MEFRRTDGGNVDFIENCRLLDEELERRVGAVIQRDKYQQFNQLDEIQEAIVIYDQDQPVGGGAIRRYDAQTVELKRVFVRAEYQRQGLGTALVSELIDWARELGYRRILLETGKLLVEAGSVYKKHGFQVIPNYGPYKNMEESLCMEMELKNDIPKDNRKTRRAE